MSPTGELIYYGVAIVVSTVVVNVYLRDYAERARKHDHVVRSSRDIALPDHCVWCGSAHAAIRLATVPKFVGVSPGRIASNPKFRRKYDFLYCSKCAKPIQRHRAMAKRIMIGSFLFVLHFAGIIIVLALLPDGTYYHFPPGSLWSILLHPGFLLLDVAGWGILFNGGMLGMRYSPAVKIIDSGDREEQVYYRFANQVYRNHFAELNGEGWDGG